jgi:hypothetical protein
MKSPSQKKRSEQAAITNPQALKTRMSDKMLSLFSVIPVLMGLPWSRPVPAPSFLV